MALSGAGGTPSAGPVTLSVSSLNWVTAGTLQDVNVQNYGNTPLTIRGITSNSSYFAVANNACGTYLAAQSVCTVSVISTGISYSGGLYSSYSGVLKIDDDASAGPQTLALSSTNTSTIQLSGLYGAWPVGSTQTGITLYATSGTYNQNSSLTVSVAGTNAGDFSVSPSSCVVYGSSGCTLGVTFSPSGTGLRTAKLIINGLGYVPISGTGDPAGPSLVTTFTSSTFFQGQAVIGPNGTANDTDTYTIVNNGTTTLSLGFTLSGTNSANFSATGSNCGSIAPKATCTVAVAFSSTSVGTFTASLTIKDTASSYSQVLPLTTQVYYPTIAAVPNFINFGNQAVGTSSASQNFIIENGNFGGNIGESVTITPSTTGNFTVTSPLTCPASTTQACTFSVAFTPKSAGSFNESLTFTAPISGNQGTISLAGAGGSPVVSLSSNSLTFPPRTNGTTSVPMPVTVTNTGTLPLVVSAVNVAGAVNGNFTQTNNCSTVAVNASCTINVTFAPTATGSQSASIQILSNAMSSPDVINLSGVSN